MSISILSPLDHIQPDQFLKQYSDWIYFTLVLIFFISLSGVALRKHFDRPYVKPLIISVGIMLTVGIFKFKNSLILVFEGWGILGIILLGIIAATIPFGLCRGFGVSTGKSFFLTYILFYVLSWVQFPQIYRVLEINGLGIINLALLILFFYAIFRFVKFGAFPSLAGKNTVGNNPVEPEIMHEIAQEEDEEKLIRKNALKLTQIEMRTIDDIAKAISEIQQIIQTHQNNLPDNERQRISKILKEIYRREHIFIKSLSKLKKTIKRVGSVDINQLGEKKDRLSKASGETKETLKKEIADDEEKIKIEKTVLQLEDDFLEKVRIFNQAVGSAVEILKSSRYPLDAAPHITKSKVTLKEIFSMLRGAEKLEQKLFDITQSEEKLLKKEKAAS